MAHDADEVYVARLTRSGITLGVVSATIVLLVGWWAYQRSYHAMISHITRANAALAASVRQHAELLVTRGASSDAAIARAFRDTGAARQGSFVCLIGEDGRLLMHSSRPTMTGVQVDKTPLGDGAGSIRDLLEQHGNWAGQNTSFRGVPQVVAYSYSEPLSGLVAVHVPKRALDAQARDSVLPWALSLGFVALVLLPTTLLIMYAAFRRGRSVLARAHSREERLHSDLRQAQRLESVGRMAGGIAHDFNNMLTVIQNSAELLSADLQGAQLEVRENIEEIERASKRAGGLVRQLLAFARRQQLQPEVLDCGEVLRDLQSMLRRVLGSNVSLTVSCEDPLVAVYADRGQLEQVIVNLVINARDAMPEGGSVEVAARQTRLPVAGLRPTVMLDGEMWLELSVRDSGGGVPDAIVEHMFEPFFTTKAAQGGTGLGLSTVHGIVGQTGGLIGVHTGPDIGTTFFIYLPAAPEAPAHSASLDSPAHREAARDVAQS